GAGGMARGIHALLRDSGRAPQPAQCRRRAPRDHRLQDRRARRRRRPPACRGARSRRRALAGPVRVRLEPAVRALPRSRGRQGEARRDPAARRVQDRGVLRHVRPEVLLDESPHAPRGQIASGSDRACPGAARARVARLRPAGGVAALRQRGAGAARRLGKEASRGVSGFAIETDALTRRFGEQVAVDGIDLRVPRGSFYGFLGENGAGKSTTISMLTGLLAPTSGSLRVLDLPPDEAVKRRIGVVPDGLLLFDRLTGREHLIFVGRLYGLGRAESARRSDELLATMELSGDARKLIADYSFGMRKKLALAAALIHGPELLFLDEPFEGVDAVAKAALTALLSDLVRRGRLTVFLTSHVLEVVERLCDQVGVIHRGRLVAQ